MDEAQGRLLDEVRGLVATRTLIDNAIEQRIVECIAADLDRSMLAHVLGVDRSTLYRRHVWEAREPPCRLRTVRGQSRTTLVVPLGPVLVPSTSLPHSFGQPRTSSRHPAIRYERCRSLTMNPICLALSSRWTT